MVARAAAAALALNATLANPVWGQCPDGSPPPCGRLRQALDTSRYAILPFAHREGSQTAALDGADCAELLNEAFGRWVEVRLADKTRVYDALARRGERAPFRIPFDTALAIARALGAGKLVMGQLWIFGDTLRLTAGVYDASRGGSPMREVTTRVAANSSALGAAFNALADSLLAVDPGEVRGEGAAQTRSLRALRAYTAGQRAIRAWDLAGAADAFRAAIASDSQFAHAYLGLGQALLWAADSTPEAARDRTIIARRSGELLGKLGTTDAALLLAQQAMLEQRWPDACRRYRQMLALDSTSFAGWYGLADCNARDETVVRYPADTTRFTYRGSYETAVQAYRRALRLAPAFNLTFERRIIDRLPRMLFAEPSVRMGRDGDQIYVAFPELDGDTLAFYAVPGAVAARGNIEPATRAAALARNRRILLEVANDFVDALPGEPLAHRALAAAFEANGKLVPGVAEPRSAISELAMAQGLERRAVERARDAAARVRVLLKAGDFAAARQLGDSVLRVAPRPTAGLAGVAVLLGRPALATRFLAVDDTAWLTASADISPVSIPLRAAQAGLALLAYAAVGAPAESVIAYERRIVELTAGLPASPRLLARSALLDVPAEQVFDVLGPRPAHRNEAPGPHALMSLQWSLSHGDSTRVRNTLASWAAPGGGLVSAESPPDGVYVSTRLLLAVGDTVTAERTLDAPLDSLPALHSRVLHYLPLPGSLVRMMALRATIAAARGDKQTAQRWARAVVLLWSGAEPSLLSTVAYMQGILERVR